MSTKQMESPLRFRIGVCVFVASFCSPLLIPLVASSELSAEVKGILSGALALGIPEIGAVTAIAIMGKPGYELMKARVLGWLKKHGPPEHVSLTRYRIGLVMLTLPLLLAWLEPYLTELLSLGRRQMLPVYVAGDLMFLASFFVLGGEFWDKVRALFSHAAKVTPSEEPLVSQTPS